LGPGPRLIKKKLPGRGLTKVEKYWSKIYRYIILSVVSHEYEISSFTLWEEHRLSVSENLVLRKKFDPTRDEVTGDWTQVHSEKFHDLYFSPNIIRIIKSNNEMDRACGTYGEQERCGAH
jgi:hypothetical protein